MMNDKQRKEKEKQANRVMYITVAVMLLVMAATAAMVSLFSRSDAPEVIGSAEQGKENVPGTSAPETNSRANSGTETENTPADSGAARPTGADPDRASDPADTASVDNVPAPSSVPFSLSLPTAGTMQKQFYDKVLVWSETMEDYRTHTGIDIAASLGDPVRAAADGKVTELWYDPMMGQCVKIDHGDGYVSVYRNLAPDVPKEIGVGSSVLSGDVIGAVGESAIIEIAEEPHLHFELTQNGKSVDPCVYLTPSALSALSAEQSLTD